MTKKPLSGEEKRKKTSRELMRIGGTIALRSITMGMLLKREAKIEVKDVENTKEAKTCLNCGAKFDQGAFCSAECMRAANKKQKEARDGRITKTI